MEKHIEQYLNDIHNLLPSLIESYVYYYGEEYRNRITEVINSITWIVKDKEANFLGTDNEQRTNELKNEENFESIRQNIKDSKACLITKHIPPILAIDYTSPIAMHDLVHEINHALHCKKTVDNRMSSMYSFISSIMPERYIYVEGISSKNESPYLYEMFNEYMTIEILEHHSTNNKIPNLSYDFDIMNYTYIDLYLNNMIKDFYEQKKNMIASDLIDANGNLLKEKLGAEEYEKLEANLIELYKRSQGAISNFLDGSEDLITEKDAAIQIAPLFVLNLDINKMINEIGQSIEKIKKVPNL